MGSEPSGSAVIRTEAPLSSLGAALLPRSNSLNLLRLVLAGAVVLSHSIELGGYGSEHLLRWTTLGSIAVYCFFGISGYLIAGSARAHSFGRFLWHRGLRILPAFWVCLVVVAFGFAWLGWLHGQHGCGFSCFIHQPVGPVTYVTHNAFLRITQLTIDGSLHGVPTPYGWNGSIWTLFYEFICYLIIGVLALVGVLRSRVSLVGIAVTIWLLLVLVTAVPGLNVHFNGFNHWELTNLMRFVPVFLVGSIIYLYKERVPDSGWIALGSVALMLLTYLVPVGGSIPAFTLTRADLSAFLLVYPILWLGAHLPGRSIGVRNDYSYGLYIYAFPVAQLLAIWGAYRWGYFAYTGLTLVVAGTLAVASWWLVEKHALRLKDAVPGRPHAVVVPESPPVEATPERAS